MLCVKPCIHKGFVLKIIQRQRVIVLLNGVAELDAMQRLLASHLGLALTGQEPRCTGRQKSHAIHRTAWGGFDGGKALGYVATRATWATRATRATRLHAEDFFQSFSCLFRGWFHSDEWY